MKNLLFRYQDAKTARRVYRTHNEQYIISYIYQYKICNKYCLNIKFNIS